MVEIVIGSGAKTKIQQVSLLNNTIRQQIDNMAVKVYQQVCSKIKQSTLQASIQLDKSTDSALESHLIAFTGYEKEEDTTLSAKTTAADVKAFVNSFLKARS